jgi:phenylacetate-CoA ligase
MKLLTRSDLPAPGSGLIFAQSPADTGVSLSPAEVEAMQALSRTSLEIAGLEKRDRVLMAVSQEGSPSAHLLAQAASTLAGSVAVTSPRGRLRLLTTIRTLKPNTLVITPCGAADLLARLYLEFNIDPVELELTRIVLLGEIASPGLRKRLGKEFEAEVSELYCDPVFGAALAARSGVGWEVADPETLMIAPIENSPPPLRGRSAPPPEAAGCETQTGRFPPGAGWGVVPPLGDSTKISEGGDSTPHPSPLRGADLPLRGGGAFIEEGELILSPTWASSLAGSAIRTGQVIQGKAGDAGLFNHTVGEHVLARGQWLSLPRLRKQLALIDGAARWSLTIDRGDRTLDSIVLTVGLDRETLVSNPMWTGRIQQAVAATTPVKVEVKTELATPDDGQPKEAVIDLRGHHLGVDRAMVG